MHSIHDPVCYSLQQLLHVVARHNKSLHHIILTHIYATQERNRYRVKLITSSNYRPYYYPARTCFRDRLPAPSAAALAPHLGIAHLIPHAHKRTPHTHSLNGSPAVIHTTIHQDSHTLRLELLPEPIHTSTLSEGNPNPIVSPKVASHALHPSFLIPHSLLRQFASTRQTHTHLRCSGTPWHYALANSPILAANDVAFIQKPGQLRSLCVP